MGHDGLAVRHALDREDAVPEVVHLIDHDVRAPEPLDRLVVGDAVHDVEVDRQRLARGDDVARPLLLEVGGGVDDERPLPLHRGHRPVLAQVEAGRDDLRVGDPAGGRIRADEAAVEPLPVLELLRPLAADVVAQEVHHGLPAGRAHDRHLQRLRHERLAEVEVEDVRLGEVAREGAPLDGLPSEQARAAGQAQVDVVLVGSPLLGPEDEQARVHALAAERVHVRPAGAGEVDRQVEDAHRHERER